MLTPFAGSGEAQFNQEQQHWNQLVSSKRSYIERTFGIMKQRFQILKKGVDMKYESALNTVIACYLQ